MGSQPGLRERNMGHGFDCQPPHLYDADPSPNVWDWNFPGDAAYEPKRYISSFRHFAKAISNLRQKSCKLYPIVTILITFYVILSFQLLLVAVYKNYFEVVKHFILHSHMFFHFGNIFEFDTYFLFVPVQSFLHGFWDIKVNIEKVLNGIN
jgi:hypothetical protein